MAANKRTVGIIIALVILACVVAGANLYFMYYLNVEEAPHVSSTRALENMIRQKIRELHPVYLNRNPRLFMYRNKLLKNYKPASYENASVLWDIANWVIITNYKCSLLVLILYTLFYIPYRFSLQVAARK